MKLYRLFIPKRFNDGKKIPSNKILKIAEEIREKFGAYSLDPFGRLPIIQGVWTSEDKKKYQEEMNILDLFVEDTFNIKKWFKAKREIWRQELEQEELFIIVQDAEIITNLD